MMMPSSPPPPPIPEELQSTKEEGGKKEKKKKKRSKSREHSSHNMSAVDGMHHHHPMMMQNGDVPRGNGGEFRGSNSVINGPTSRGRQQSVNSLLPPPHMRPMNGHGPPRGGGGGGGPMPPMGPLPPPHMMMPPMNGKKAGTFSARGKKGRGMPHPFMMFPPQHYPPPHLMPPPGHPLYNGVMPPPPPQGPPSRGPGFAAEEPIYMPHNARPLSPVASYQPGHFPHEAYYSQQQYATIDKANKYRKNKPGSTKNGGKTSGSSKQPSSDSNADNDSEFGAGIYKKGHINERAFSYSIRNEHRSRSFGSLANMQFGPNGEAIMPQSGPVSPHHQNGNGIEQQQHSGENGGPVPNGKAGGGPPPRDYLNMMTDLDLADESIERSEVPPGLYQPGMGHHHPGMMPPPHMMMHGGGPPGPHMDPRHHQAMMAAAAHAHVQHQQQQQPQGKKKR